MGVPNSAKLSTKYTSCVDRFKILILAWWGVCLVVGGIFGPALLTKTVNTFAPPPNSLAGKGNVALGKAFPEIVGSSDLAIYIQTTNGVSVLTPAMEQFSLQLNKSIYDYKPNDPNFIQEYQGYYVALAMGLPDIMADSFVAESQTATILTLTFNSPYSSPEAGFFSNYVQDKIKEFWPTDENTTRYFDYTVTGIPAFITVVQESGERDFALVDGVALPIALLVLAYIIRSLRLLIIPLLATATSVLTTFAIMRCVTLFIDVFAFTPSLMMSILVAMNIDYSLFLLSRYREALLDEGGIGLRAVRAMVSSAGHTILVSGITLAGTFAGLIILPLEMLRTLGIGSAVSIIMTLLVSMTLTPALLLTFNSFFERCILPFNCCGRVIKFGSKKPKALTINDSTSSIESEPLMWSDIQTAASKLTREGITSSTHSISSVSSVSSGRSRSDSRSSMSSINSVDDVITDRPDGEKSRNSFWYKLGRVTMQFPYNIIIILVVVGATIPSDLHSFNYKTTDSMTLTLPRNTKITNAYLDMCAEFGYGTVYPYKLLMLPPNNMSVLSDEFFVLAQGVITTLSQMPNTTINNFNGLVEAHGITTQYSDEVEPCLDPTLPIYNTSFCIAFQYARNMFVNTDGSAMWISVILDWDPIDQNGFNWLDVARKVLKEQEDRTGATFYLTGLVSDSLDAITATYDIFPIMISITAGVVLVFVGIAFRSVLVPLRAILTVSLTISFVYGFATLTYQYGIFKFLHFYGLAPAGAILWLAPIISFSIIVGIGLDYDIFLLTRVREYRMMGYSTHDAVLRGLYKTGRIITAAGIIMAIAFSGLLFSSIAAMNHLAFYLVFSVLFDTFIVRSLLVPSIMGLLYDINWWPARLPNIVMEPLFLKNLLPTVFKCKN